MLYYISNNRSELCHSNIEKTLDISENNLQIGNYLLKTNNISPWTWVQIINSDDSFSFIDNAFYLKQDLNTNNNIIEIREDLSTGNAIIVGKFGICPTQTPTPSVTPSNTVTPTPSETPPETPTVTPTQTVTPSSPLISRVYYVSANLNKLCYNTSSLLVKTLILFIRDNLLSENYFLYRNNIATNKWLFNDLLLRLGLSSNITTLYLKDSISGVVYSIIENNNFAVIDSNNIACPPVYISNILHDVCHLSNNPVLNINTNNLLEKEYLYKTNGVDLWQWSELLELDNSFANETTLYIYYEEENARLSVKQDILSGNAIIVSTTTICPTPTPTNTPSQTNTKTPTPTPTNTLTPSVTESQTPTPTHTSTPTPSSTDVLGGTYYYLSDDPYVLCHNNLLTKFVIYDDNNIVDLNDVLYKDSGATENYTIEDLNDILGISDVDTLYIRPVGIENEWYRVRIVEDVNGSAKVISINDCVTPTPTATTTQTPTHTSTQTPTQTPTQTSTSTQTPTTTETTTQTPTLSPTNTITPTETPTETPTQTPTPSETPTNTPTNTQTPTETPTQTPTKTETPTPTRTTSYLIKGISININNIVIGNRYEVEFGTDNYGIARIFDEKINFMATSDPQRVNVRVGFAANVPSVIVYVKVTDLDSGRVEYNSVFIKCSDISDCY